MKKGKPWAEFESYVAKLFNLRQTIASGNKFWDSGDAVGDRHDVFPLWAEAKCTERKSFSLREHDLLGYYNRALESGRKFFLPLRFQHANGRYTDWAVVNMYDLKELLDMAREER